MNMLCLLPNTAIKVDVWVPHPEGGYYVIESWCYGPHGKIGYWVDEKMYTKTISVIDRLGKILRGYALMDHDLTSRIKEFRKELVMAQ